MRLSFNNPLKFPIIKLKKSHKVASGQLNVEAAENSKPKKSSEKSNAFQRLFNDFQELAEEGSFDYIDFIKFTSTLVNKSNASVVQPHHLTP